MKTYQFKNQLRSEAMSIYNAIKGQYINKSAAMSQAWKVAKAKQALKANQEVILTFCKKGEEVPTVRFGTLNTDFFSYEYKHTGRKRNALQVSYFEHDSQSFKSFLAPNLIQFKAVA